MNTNQKILIGIIIIILILLIGAYAVSRSNNAVVTPTPSPTPVPTTTPTPVPSGNSGPTTEPQITPTPTVTSTPTPGPDQNEAREGQSSWPYYNFHWSPTLIPVTSISIVKYVNGEDANAAPGLYVTVGEPVTWTYTVTNTGNVPLTNVEVTDDQGVAVTMPKTTLNKGESMTGTASGTATAGQYTNIGTATGSYGSGTVTDTDAANYFGASPGIYINMTTNGADGLLIPVDAVVTWQYAITNTGNVPLDHIEVADNMSVTPAYVSGDTNANNMLDPAETWTYTATGTAAAGDYANSGTVTGTPPVGTPVTDDDTSSYTGVLIAFDFKKYVSVDNGATWQDADSAPGPSLVSGTSPQFRFRVANTGEVMFTNVAITDDFYGFIGSYSPLNPGASGWITITVPWVAGQHTNTATASLSYNDAATNTVTISDSDTANYYGAAPAISIVKLVNGENANTAPGPSILVGSSVTWTYVVTNTGNVPLTGIAVIDDQGVTVTTPKTTLEPGESMTGTASGTATAGQYTNIGTATGSYGSTPVTASDPANYFGALPAISIVKYVNGQDANTQPGPVILSGSSVTWTYTVTNTGNVPLTNVEVTDDQGVAVTIPKTTLSPGESMTGTASGTAIPDQYTNIGTATGSYGSTPVTASDPANYFGAAPAISIVKYVNGQDANTAPGVYITVGQDVFWTYTVTNTGNVPLTNVEVTDDQGVAVTMPKITLAVGESMTGTAAGIATAGQYTNIGTATGSYGSTPVTASDPANYFGV